MTNSVMLQIRFFIAYVHVYNFIVFSTGVTSIRLELEYTSSMAIMLVEFITVMYIIEEDNRRKKSSLVEASCQRAGGQMT